MSRTLESNQAAGTTTPLTLKIAQRVGKNSFAEGWNLENSDKNYIFTDSQDVPERWKVKAGNQRRETVQTSETKRLETKSTLTLKKVGRQNYK